jgi:hypothetical protein
MSVPNFNLQSILNDGVKALNIDKFIESVAFLPKDTAAPANAYVVSLRDPQGEKAEVAVVFNSPIVGFVVSFVLKSL